MNQNNIVEGALGSLIASAIWYLLTGTVLLIVYFFRKNVLLIKLKTILKVHIYDSNSILSTFDWVLFGICFRKSLVSGELQWQNPKFAAIFLVLLPSYLKHKKSYDSNVHFDELVNISRLASRYDYYRELLVEKSLIDCFGVADKSLLSSLLKGKRIEVRGQAEEGEMKLSDRLRKRQQSRMINFSVTGQISELSRNTLRDKGENVQALEMFLTSPMLLSHTAIDNLNIEYQGCAEANKPSQFLPNRKLDAVRRSLKIYDSIVGLTEVCDATKASLKIFLFINVNPRVKIVTLEPEYYSQLKVGGLPYPNNMYRFGIETDDAHVTRELISSIEKMKSSDNIELLRFDGTGLHGIRLRILKEATIFMLRNGISCHDLKLQRNDFFEILKGHNARKAYDELYALSLGAINSLLFYSNSLPVVKYQKSNEYAAEYVSGKGESHITVAMLFLRNDSILMIQKKKSHFADKWSIVAGHVDKGETPRAAILREVKEEIGISIKNFCLIKYLDCVDGDKCKTDVSVHSWYIYLCRERIEDPKVIPSEEEIKSFKWVRFDSIAKLELTLACSIVLSQFNFGDNSYA